MFIPLVRMNLPKTTNIGAFAVIVEIIATINLKLIVPLKKVIKFIWRKTKMFFDIFRRVKTLELEITKLHESIYKAYTVIDFLNKKTQSITPKPEIPRIGKCSRCKGKSIHEMVRGKSVYFCQNESCRYQDHNVPLEEDLANSLKQYYANNPELMDN